jgi:hypothetical protein
MKVIILNKEDWMIEDSGFGGGHGEGWPNVTGKGYGDYKTAHNYGRGAADGIADNIDTLNYGDGNAIGCGDGDGQGFGN